MEKIVLIKNDMNVSVRTNLAVWLCFIDDTVLQKHSQYIK